MTELVGVEDGRVGLRIPTPKRDILLFDKIGVWGLDYYIESLYKGIHSESFLAADFEWLAGRGIIFDPGFPSESEIEGVEKYRKLLFEINSRIKELKHYLYGSRRRIYNADGTTEVISPDKRAEYVSPEGINPLERSEYINMLYNVIGSLRSRLIADYLTRIGECDACSLWHVPGKIPQSFGSLNEGAVIQLVLTKFPLPDDSVPLERIVDFRDNPATNKMRTSLRRWIHGVVRRQMIRSEANVELEDLINQYEAAMDIAQIKYSNGRLEIVLTAMAESFENLLRIKPGKTIKSLFDIRRRRVNLLEAETKAPGREISLISKARKEFLE